MVSPLLRRLQDPPRFRFIFLRAFNPYHVPGGSPEGGQFTTADDGGGEGTKLETAHESLSPAAREVYDRFKAVRDRDPQAAARAYGEQVASAPKNNNVFSPDDAKMLSKDYAASAENRALYNVAVHQTAHAIAKDAFIQKLDELARGPEGNRTVLVTAGGCAAGKGYALGSLEETRSVASQVGAVWDSAGEQNSTDLSWIEKETSARGITPIYAFVGAQPEDTFARSLERAAETGRVVDERLYYDSYAIGARRFADFVQSNPDRQYIFIDGRGTPPKLMSEMPRVPVPTWGQFKSTVDRIVEQHNPPAHVRTGLRVLL